MVLAVYMGRTGGCQILGRQSIVGEVANRFVHRNILLRAGHPCLRVKSLITPRQCLFNYLSPGLVGSGLARFDVSRGVESSPRSVK